MPPRQEYIEQAPIVVELTVEERIRMTFPEAPETMVAIAKCESELRQFKEDGSVLVSPTSDRGIFQINQIHFEDVKKLGYDIDTVDGNLKYARHLYDRNGTGDWYMSKHCWGKKSLAYQPAL